MKRQWKVLLCLVSVGLVTSMALAGTNSNAQDHASENALLVVPYQSALMDREDLPGEPIPWFGSLTIDEDEYCYYAIGIASRIGRGARDDELGPGRSNEEFHGSGALKVSLTIGDEPIRLNRTGGVTYTEAFDPQTGEPIIAWFQTNEFWVVFPPGTFEPGEYDVVFNADVSRDPKFPITLFSTLTVNPAP